MAIAAMTVRILFFSTLRDYTGAKTIELEIPMNSTVAELKASLLGRYPRMSTSKNSMVVAVNREFAADDQVIPVNAEVALFPPVSGG